MNNNKKSILATTLIAGAMFGAAGTINAAPSNLFSFNDLGTGAEVRTALLETSTSFPANFLELKCGEKAKTKLVKADKSKEAKCGEGKCGEGKCGEAKCGEKKAAGKKAEAKTTSTDSKSKDAKCGEAKCGEAKCGNK
jgi:uncharacterized low-complexity protein